MTDSDDDRAHDSFAYHLTRGTWPPARDAHLPPRSFRIEVRDEGVGFERPAPSSRTGSGGFGLLIVDRIATRWGAATDQGNCVWFELDR